jgi:hypothetical protein
MKLWNCNCLRSQKHLLLELCLKLFARTWIATDLCGLTATHVQTVTVQESTAPTFVETLQLING